MRDKINSLEINNIIIITLMFMLPRVSHRDSHENENFTLFADNYIIMKSITKISCNNSINFLSSQLYLSVLITSALLLCLRFVLVLLGAIFYNLA